MHNRSSQKIKHLHYEELQKGNQNMLIGWVSERYTAFTTPQPVSDFIAGRTTIGDLIASFPEEKESLEHAFAFLL